MLLPPPVLSRTDALFPSTTLFLSAQRRDGAAGDPLLDRLRPRALARRPDPVRSGLSGLPAFRGIVSGRRDGRRRRENDRCGDRSEEHTSELQSLMRISYAVFCLKKTTEPYINSTSRIQE